MSPPLAVSPEAAFIAASAASQIVTNDHDSHSETWYDQVGIEPSGETALVSAGALLLANNFVDQLLFNIIGVARSTTLAALRPAVSEVLKTKLAQDAINQADEELKEYLGGGEVDDLVHSPTEDTSRDWDLELVWKRTRLRCMVYSSLGDLEEEDEDYFMEQEHLNAEVDEQPDTTVSPAVAIFLTSILEFMGEQVLVVAGQAAFNRLRARYEKELKDGTRLVGDVSERIVIEDLDMERVALDRTLGRLWRSWKKRIRSPTEPNFARPFPRSATHSRRGSTATEAIHVLAIPQEEAAPYSDEENGQPTPELLPSDIPLPIGDNDIAEIEVPGLVSYNDDDDRGAEMDEAPTQPPRPKSLMIFSSFAKEPQSTSGSAQQQHPTQAMRRRASSLPTSAPSPYASPVVSKLDEQSAQKEDVEGPPSKVSDGDIHEASLAPIPATQRKVNEDGVSPLDTESSDYSENKLAEETTSPISLIVSSAAAFGSAAVAGVAAMAQGNAPQTIPTPMEEEEIEEFTEEPEIMTSSRVSFGGRSSPSASESEKHRPPSMLLVRSNSLRSVRMIDVQGPRTPSIKSRNGSMDFPDLPNTRPASISREGSISTPPIAEEGMGSNNLSISALKRNAVVAPPSVPSEEYRDGRNPRDFGSTNTYFSKPVALTSAPAPTGRVAPTSAPSFSDNTKVTTMNPLAANRSFLDLDTKPDVPEKTPLQRQPSPLPTVPEKSANRNSGHGSYGRKPSIDRTQPNARGSSESPRATRAKLNDSPSSSSSNKYKPVRSSEDSNPHRAQDVARNFEELLQNDQTIQYTLTPENMRDIEAVSHPSTSYSTLTAGMLTFPQSKRSATGGGGPAGQPKSRRSEDVQHADRARSSSLKRSLSVTRSAGLNSHPPEQHAGTKSNGKLSGPIPRAPPVSMTNYHARGTGPSQARDARVPRESVSDFADFIRSTGPAGGKASPTGPVPATTIHSRSTSSSVPRNTSIDTTRPRQGSINRVRLQARDAAVSASNESSDLIDFIRRGPPSTGGNNPRIPRNVAPFRSTMDSDQLQMSGAGGGKAVDAVIPDLRQSRTSTAMTENSLPSSINSNSALLNQAKKPAQYTGNFDDEDMIPKRKQRRVRDPYAIDFSDEEEDEDFEIAPQPKPKAKKEESLIDFLNNYDPPGESGPPQPFIPAQAPQALPKKKPSTSNMFSRLRSAGSGSTSAPKNNTANPTQPRATSSQASNGRNYTPISTNIPAGASFSNSSNQSTGTRTASNPSGGRVLMKRYEPREAASAGMGRTADLASFLRDSEPPPSAMPPPPVARQEEKPSSGFSGVFGRRKKSSVY